MKIKKGLEVCSSDFWYDLTDSGYLQPYHICANEKDARKVYEAICTLREFQDSCEEQIEGFMQ